MPFVADFHIHSKYSRATSRDMDVDHIVQWAKLKGVDLMGSGDFTHPQWILELKEKLEPVEYGLFLCDDIYFMLTTEVSNIYSKNGKTHKVHNIIFAPTFDAVSEISNLLGNYGILISDGRPIFGLHSDEMVRMLRKINPDIFIVPAHAWTPWFSVFGSKSGFDSIEECYEEETQYIYALETGLSSDPAMNWRWSALDRFSLISNSDSHSPAKIGREANVFKNRFGYKELIDILKTKDRSRFLYTIEFFPQEGKYHWDGHRNCNVSMSPKDTKAVGGKCPACGRHMTIGVMNRVDGLSDRGEGVLPENSIPFKSLVPLGEIIADVRGVKSVSSVTVQKEYRALISNFGTEFNILLDAKEEDLARVTTRRIASAITRVRRGEIKVIPGYDGVYGQVKVFTEEAEPIEQQLELF